MRRYDMHRLQELVRLHRQGRAVREVARVLGMGPNSERQYRRALRLAGLLDGDPSDLPDLEVLRRAVAEHLPDKPAPQQTSSIEAWAGRVVEMAQRGAHPKSIWDALRLEDPAFQGSLDAVKRVWRRWRKAKGPQAEDVAIPVVTEPGEVAYVDFGYLGNLFDKDTGRMKRAWVFVMVLGFSRRMFCRIVLDQAATTWVRLHVQAFAALGGVPKTVVPDNLKAAVIRAAFGVDRDDSGLNRTYRELARHYGFVIDPTPPRSPKKKGKVESGVRYVKSNFWKPRALEELEGARAELQRWVDGIADQRVHGTTCRKPIELFEESERQALLSLPARPYVPVTWKGATVHPNSHVLFERREYSVPWTRIGQKVWLRATPTSVCVYADDERIATHDRKTGLGPPCTIDGHLPEHRRELRHRSRAFWLQRARLIGEEAEQLVIEVFGSEDGLSRLRVVQAIVTHLEKHPKDRANAACERARFYGNHTYAGVRDILRKGLDQQPLPAPLFADPARPRPRFSRAPTGEA